MSSQETNEDTTPAAADRTRAGVPVWMAVVAVIVLVAGLTVLGVGGTRYLQARSAHQVAQEREEVAETAAQVIINAFSFDHRDVDESLKQLAAASTGDFLAEQEQWAQDVRTRVVEQKAVTTATVSHTAVEILDRDAGDAAVLVVFTAHSEREGQDDITGRQAMRVDLTRVDGQWKADAVNQVGVTVPVGQSSQSVQDLAVPEEGAGEQGTDEQGNGEQETGGNAGAAGETDDAPEAGETTPAPTTTAGR
ncbi:hypothetical protein [Dietzia lutea]|uniref:Mce-associated membrane protein n=1 Tax=Dietzia lutea TaxID=546160 RepID=A0A2S1R903_9ACTN|nr:hypothetical protein [Dietzia lutea]AWH92742.1 hypothetical protein A6035_11795 [Dietzia lutea]